MHSFRTRLGIVTLLLLATVLGIAYVYVRVTLPKNSESYGKEIIALSQNNAFLINTAYEDTYSINKKRFFNLVSQSLSFSKDLSHVEVIDRKDYVVFDSNKAEVSGTSKTFPEITKKIRRGSGEEYIVDPTYCAPSQEITTSDSYAIMEGVLKLLTDNVCEYNETHTIELIYPDTGNQHLSIRYLFTYAPLHTWLFNVLMGVILSMIIIIVVYVVLLLKVAFPLATLRSGAIEMAKGNLTHKVRVSGNNEMNTVAHFMNEVARNLVNVISDLEEKNRLVSELDVASKIQSSLLPTEAPDLPGLELIGKTKSSTEVGGDIYNYLQVDENHTLVYIGDVTGHGVPACLLMIMVDELLNIFSRLYTSVRDIMVSVNSNLAPRIDTTLFVTMLLFSWDVRRQRFTYSSAGHEHIIHYHAKTATCEAIRSGGIALGMLMDDSPLVEEKELIPEDGDAVIIYTDGVTESLNPNGEQFSLARLKEVVNKYGYRNAEGLFDGIAKELSNFIGDEPQRDDITMVVMKHKATTPEEIEQHMVRAREAIQERATKRTQKAVWDWEKKAK